MTKNQQDSYPHPKLGKGRLSRRRFLLWTAGAAAGAAGIGVPVAMHYATQIRDLPLPTDTTRSMTATTHATMAALIEAIFPDEPIDVDRYMQYLEIRADNVPGYGDLYAQFQADVDRLAEQAHDMPFAETPITARRDIISPWFTIPQSRTERATTVLTNGVPWLTYSHRIFAEILTIYMRTDAWVAIGYDSYPGTPRGLDNYKLPIEPNT